VAVPDPAAPAARPGLRLRKAARTHAAIQRAAWELFAEHGYDATTMNQIADAAEVSPSTLFRYYPSKEALVLTDDLDPPMLDALRDQPAGLAPVPALRAAIAAVVAGLSVDERAAAGRRLRVMLAVPPLRAALLDQAAGPVRRLAEVLAGRAGRSPEDLAVRTLVGALVGTCLAALGAAADDPQADPLTLVDEALARLEQGLPV
jgi:AcrR family transcriptional regulator